MEAPPEQTSKEVDIYRDTWVRFLGKVLLSIRHMMLS